MHDKMKIYGVTDYFILAELPDIKLIKKKMLNEPRQQNCWRYIEFVGLSVVLKSSSSLIPVPTGEKFL